MVQIIQTVGVLFGLFALINVYLSYKRNIIRTYGFLFWELVWISTIAVAVYPSILRIISDVLQIERGIDSLIYVSIVVLFYLLFKLYVRYDALEKEITKLVRMISLEQEQCKTNNKGHKKA